MTTKDNSKNTGKVTDCCKSPNYLSRKGSKGDYYVCENCQQTCDLIPPTTEDVMVLDEIDKLLLKINHISILDIAANTETYIEAKALIEQEIKKARRNQTEVIRDEWAKWLAFDDDVDEAKISDIVNHCNLLISELG